MTCSPLSNMSEAGRSEQDSASGGDESEGEQDMWALVKSWTRQEHDGQWLSIGIFTLVAILGAALITQAQVIPGYKVNPLMEGSDTLDISWDEDGDVALAIVEDSSTSLQSLVLLSGSDEKTLLANTEFNSVQRVDDGWLIAGDDGYLGTCDDPCTTISSKVLSNWSSTSDWKGNTDGQDIIDVVSEDGDSGVLLIQDPTGSMTVRYFEADKVTAAADPLAQAMNLDRMVKLPGGEILAVGSMTTTHPSWSDTDQNPASLPTRGLIAAVDMSLPGGETGLVQPTEEDGGSVQVDNSEPEYQLEIIIVHIGENGKYHSIMKDCSSAGVAIIAGTSSALRLDSDMSITSVEGVPGSTSAVADSSGTIWFAGDLDTSRVGMLEVGELAGETVEVPSSAGFDSVLAVQSGDQVHFHGSSDGERVTLDSQTRNSVSSLSVMGDYLFLICGLIIMLTMAWNLYDNWHLGSW